MSTRTADTRVDYKIIFTLTLVHFTGDFYSSFFTPLLPVFVDKLELTLVQVGLITGIVRFLAFMIQPAAGYLADRYQGRSFIFAGLFLTFFCIPFTGWATNFWVLLLALGLGSIGSSMFHPATTGMVSLYAGNRNGFAQSIFNTGGTLAFAVGPVFITWYVALWGLEAMPLTGLIGLFAFLFCLKYLPRPVSENMSNLGFFGSIKASLGTVYKAIILIWLVMVIRAVTGQAFMTFMPIYLSDKGMALTSVGLIVSLFVLAGTLSGLLAGYLADRTSIKHIFFTCFALMPPSLLLFLYATDWLVYPAAFFAGFASLAALPLGVVLAQKLAPHSRSMMASLMMGFAYGLGGVVSPIVGKFADMYGLETVLFWTALVPFVCLLLIARFPNVR